MEGPGKLEILHLTTKNAAITTYGRNLVNYYQNDKNQYDRLIKMAKFNSSEHTTPASCKINSFYMLLLIQTGILVLAFFSCCV